MIKAIIATLCDHFYHVIYRELAVLSIMLLNDNPLTFC